LYLCRQVLGYIHCSVVLFAHPEHPLDRNAHLFLACVRENPRSIRDNGLRLPWPRQARKKAIQDLLLSRIHRHMRTRPFLFAPGIPQSVVMLYDQLPVSATQVGTAGLHRGPRKGGIDVIECVLPRAKLSLALVDPLLFVVRTTRQGLDLARLRVQRRDQVDATGIDRDNASLSDWLQVFLPMLTFQHLLLLVLLLHSDPLRFLPLQSLLRHVEEDRHRDTIRGNPIVKHPLVS